MSRLEVGQMCTQLLAELDSCICQGTGWRPAAGVVIQDTVCRSDHDRGEQSRAQQCSAEHISNVQGALQPGGMPAA